MITEFTETLKIQKDFCNRSVENFTVLLSGPLEMGSEMHLNVLDRVNLVTLKRFVV